MSALIKLHIKENLRKNTFIIFAIIGGLISLVIISSGTFTVNSAQVSSEYAQLGYQWQFLTLISSLAAVSLSMSVIPKHREGNTMELLKLHGLSYSNQFISRIIGNVLLAILMAVILKIGMTVNIIIKGTDFSLINYLGSIGVYLFAGIGIAILVSLLSLVFAPAITALFGVFISGVGFLRGILLISVGNMGGPFGKVMTGLLNLIPPIDNFGELARDVFFGEVSNWNILFGSAIYLWVLIGVTYLTVKVVSQNEK